MGDHNGHGHSHGFLRVISQIVFCKFAAVRWCLCCFSSLAAWYFRYLRKQLPYSMFLLSKPFTKLFGIMLFLKPPAWLGPAEISIWTRRPCGCGRDRVYGALQH